MPEKYHSIKKEVLQNCIIWLLTHTRFLDLDNVSCVGQHKKRGCFCAGFADIVHTALFLVQGTKPEQDANCFRFLPLLTSLPLVAKWRQQIFGNHHVCVSIFNWKFLAELKGGGRKEKTPTKQHTSLCSQWKETRAIRFTSIASPDLKWTPSLRPVRKFN